MTLVDASSWIEFLRQRASTAGLRVKAMLGRGEAAWCELTLVELWNGAQEQAEKTVIKELEAEMRLYTINEHVWAKARALARRCRDRGVTAPTTDIIVAACASRSSLDLEHCDRHFDQIVPIARTL